MDNSLSAIMFFARHPTQTPDEVFNMLQERMIAMLWCKYFLCGSTYQADQWLSNWQKDIIVLSTDDFERLGAPVNLSINDVLGKPDISPSLRHEIERQLDTPPIQDGIDPVLALIMLSFFEEFNTMAKLRKELINEFQD